jgi:hypothetical protein
MLIFCVGVAFFLLFILSWRLVLLFLPLRTAYEGLCLVY